MSIGIAFSLILGFILIYVSFIEIYSILFRITGLTKIKSRFQAISLLTNSGYTTSESEVVTTNKLRRNIAIASMLTGYVFSVIIVSLTFNLIATINIKDLQENYLTIIIIFSIFALLLILFKLPFVKKPFEKLIEFLARKIMKKDIAENIITLLDIYENDTIAEITINNVPPMMIDKKLSEINMRDFSINLLLLKRDGQTQTATKETIIQKGDIIIVFGPLKKIKKLFISKERKSDE
ncbi:MAG: TrkA C-terminal domain-containing protein [Clostridia bacterium]|nr:TrkA C-terminal domain-containing protein [Clostridia bacterium]